MHYIYDFSFISSNVFFSFKSMNYSGGTGIFICSWLLLHSLLFLRKYTDVNGKYIARERERQWNEEIFPKMTMPKVLLKTFKSHAWQLYKPWTLVDSGKDIGNRWCMHAKSFVVSDSVQPHRRQPTRLLCPCDSPGKTIGVGCHFLLQCMLGCLRSMSCVGSVI